MAADLTVHTLAPDGKWATACDEACWHVFSDPGAKLHPQLASLLHQSAMVRPDLDIVYGDEVVAASAQRAPEQIRKPEFDRTQLIAQDYIGLPIAIRGRTLAMLGGLDASAGSAQVYDLLLRAVANGLGIGHIAQVFAINPADAARPAVLDRRTVLARMLARIDPACEVVPGLLPSTLELRRKFDETPHVTVLILPYARPMSSAISGLPDFLLSLGNTDWPADRLHILLEENSLADGEQCSPFTVERVTVTGFATLAARVNRLWQGSGTEHVVFLGQDLRANGPGWLRALMTFAVDEGVGGVGARLLNPDSTIRHAGGPCGAPSPFSGMPMAAPTYQNWAMIHRECSVVSGEVFATRRSLLQQVNGLDHRFGFDVGQADLCLRLRQLGYRIVYTPHAEFTRCHPAAGDPGPDETARFLEKWQQFVLHDPAYHPQLNRIACPINPEPSEAEWWQTGTAS